MEVHLNTFGRREKDRKRGREKNTLERNGEREGEEEKLVKTERTAENKKESENPNLRLRSRLELWSRS